MEHLFHFRNGEAPSETQSNDDEIFLKNLLSYHLFIDCKEVKREKNWFLYAIPAIRHLEFINTPALQYSTLSVISGIIETFLTNYNLKQLDHCLAGLMFHLVHYYRRSLPESERSHIQ